MRTDKKYHDKINRKVSTQALDATGFMNDI